MSNKLSSSLKEAFKEAFTAGARNSLRRERGEQSRDPLPNCKACNGTGWVVTRLDDEGTKQVTVRCECIWPPPN